MLVFLFSVFSQQRQYQDFKWYLYSYCLWLYSQSPHARVNTIGTKNFQILKGLRKQVYYMIGNQFCLYWPIAHLWGWSWRVGDEDCERVFGVLQDTYPPKGNSWENLICVPGSLGDSRTVTPTETGRIYPCLAIPPRRERALVGTVSITTKGVWQRCVSPKGELGLS